MNSLSKIFLLIGGAFIMSLFLINCRSGHAEIKGFGEILSPKDNPMNQEKIELGKKLFFDKRLSQDETISCASCHVPDFAFTDRKKVSNGVNGGLTERNSPTLLNSGYLPSLMFDAHLTSLEMQAIVPIQEHVEMDMKMKDLIGRLKNVSEYQEAALKIFNRDFDPWVLTRSLAAFERSLLSKDSRFDRYYYNGDKKALTKAEIKGWKIFSEKLYCTQCHPAPYFSTFKAESNGLYSDYGKDQGRYRIHHDSADIGKFKVPTLRNIELTYPYMHDGNMNTIDEIIDHYSKGGNNHFNKSRFIVPFKLSQEEKNQLKAFLSSLTDTSYMDSFRYEFIY